jgi:hypothetical protein
MTWRGIVGKSFTPDEFEQYLHTLDFGPWRPKFVVVHNTFLPTLEQYDEWKTRRPPFPDEQWMKNLVSYYRDQQGWSAGPHLIVTDEKILAFTPLTVPGTHTPSWNAISWGVETVGDFDEERFEDRERDNLVATLASLHSLMGWDPADYKLGVRGLHFHKEDKRTTHKNCPGKKMKKPALVKAVADKMKAMNSGEHLSDRPAEV